MRARPLAALLAGLLGVAAAGHGVDDRVYLPGVNALVFTRDQVTFSRLGHPHEQLACVGGDARGDAAVMPTLVECYNKGMQPPRNEEERRRPVQSWVCHSSPPARAAELRGCEVKCEGYAFPEDLFVLRGSCRLEYRLVYVRGGGPGGGGEEEGGGGEEEGGGAQEGETFFEAACSVLRLVFILFMLYCLAAAARLCKQSDEGGGERAALTQAAF